MSHVEVMEAKVSRAGGVESGIAMNPLVANEMGADRGEFIFSNIAGVLPNEDRIRFERMIFRATRGNCYIRFSEIIPENKSDSESVRAASKGKTVFIIFYKSQAIEGKIKKICDAFNCRRFDLVDLDRPSELVKYKYIFIIIFSLLF